MARSRWWNGLQIQLRQSGASRSPFDQDARQAPPFRAGKDSAQLAERAVSDDAATGKFSLTRPTPGQGKAAQQGTRPRNRRRKPPSRNLRAFRPERMSRSLSAREPFLLMRSGLMCWNSNPSSAAAILPGVRRTCFRTQDEIRGFVHMLPCPALPRQARDLLGGLAGERRAATNHPSGAPTPEGTGFPEDLSDDECEAQRVRLSRGRLEDGCAGH